jgi:tetratricopeptide (TPR) repeat protein
LVWLNFLLESIGLEPPTLLQPCAGEYTITMRLHFSPYLAGLIVGCILSGIAAPVLADKLAEAQDLLQRGQPAQALVKIDEHVASKPEDAQGRFTKGLILSEMGRQTEATAVFAKLIEDYPELPEPYNNLAVLYARQKQFDKARTALEMAIRIQPGYATAYENLGDVYARLAGQAYDKALQLDPSRQVTQAKLARLREPGTAGKAGERSRMASTVSTGTAASPPLAVAAAPPVRPAAAAPQQQKAPPAALAADEAAVTKTLAGWANAWSRKDSRAYFAYYAADFRTPRGLTRKTWEEGRLRPMKKPGKLLVEVEEIRISFADDTATARFRQNYSSPYLKSSVGKTIVFVKSRGRWLIQQERVG